VPPFPKEGGMTRFPPISASLVLSTFLAASSATAQTPTLEAGRLPDDTMLTVAHRGHGNSSTDGGVLGRRSSGGVLGIDSIVNWSSYFYEAGLDTNGFPQFAWQYTMVGQAPFDADGNKSNTTTSIIAPITPVTVELISANSDGSSLFCDPTAFVRPVMKSPVFSSTSFSSSEEPTQFADAIQRAEFFHNSSKDWHTLLMPHTTPGLLMRVPKGEYAFSLHSDGSCRFAIVDFLTFVNLLFPATPTDTTTIIGRAENGHLINTHDLSTFLFNSVFLANIDSSGGIHNCCTIGFHSYDLEPGSALNGFREKRYVIDYSSWIQPGIFRDPTVTDITALSHEIVETFNDPFVSDITPWWLSPNGNCQNDLETGDVIEGLPNAQSSITVNGFTYHPQNEALVQWFAGVTPSNAISRAYSYPDITVLTAANEPQLPNCAMAPTRSTADGGKPR
jgi:hypothetical protein